MSIQAKPLTLGRRRDEAQGGSALHPGQGQLRRRPLVPGHALPGARAQPVPARRDQEHRHQRGDEGARRQGRDHRQGPRGRRPRVAADLPRLRQADGARDRQGALPVPGSRRRVRRDARRGASTAPRRCRSTTRRCRSSPIRSRRRPTRCCCGPTARARRTTSSTGRSATRTAPARALASSPKRDQAAHLVPALPSRRRSSRAAASRTSTRWGGCSST